MPNMDPKKCPMPSQDPNVRNKNFKEVALGYTAEMAVNEAKRCLQCKKPACRTGCPVQIDIPAFIAEVAKGDFEAAYQVIAKSSALPAVCGRVCPQENQCEGKCVRGIKGEPVGIGRLERFVADWHRENVHTPAAKPEPNGHKVAVIGAGPSGLTVAGDLAKLGYKVTVYEALHVAGGVLMYGIPEFRLPKDIVQHEVEGLKELGVDIECNMVIGKVLTVDELMNDYGFEAIYIASGAGLPRFMGIPGESLKGVYSANEYLTRVNLMKAYQPGSRTPIMKSRAVAVVGGGNVAMDAARCAKRLGAEQVYIVYRRGMAELPARKEEVEHAEEEGIIFKTLTNPVEVLGDENGCVKGMTCVEMELGEPDASGRRRPIVKEGSEFELDVDTMIMALGTSPNPLIRSTTPGLDTDKHGCIITDGPDGLTSRPFVYAGGDAVTHDLEAYASMMATDYTDGLAIRSLQMIFEYLPRAYDNGPNDPVAREKMANAATMAGMAFANAFLGVCHSMAHKLGAFHHLPHGIANALMIDEVLRFNAAEVPHKMGTFPQYDHPHTLARYAEVADALGIKGKNDEEKLENLIKAIDDLKERVGIKKTIKDYGIDEKDFLDRLDDMVEQAFDDQCTGTNPRYPLMSEIKQMYLNAYYGTHKTV